MNKPNLIRQFQRWRTSRAELLRQVEILRKENERFRERLAALQGSKDQAERQAEERRIEKDSLRNSLKSEKRALRSQKLQVEQLAVKITELRAEIIRLEGAVKTK